jgi:hypothetical protein
MLTGWALTGFQKRYETSIKNKKMLGTTFERGEGNNSIKSEAFTTAKPSQAINHVIWLRIIDVSETISVPIIRI